MPVQSYVQHTTYNHLHLQHVRTVTSLTSYQTALPPPHHSDWAQKKEGKGRAAPQQTLGSQSFGDGGGAGARRARRCDRIHPTATWPQLCPQSADHAAVPRTSVRLPKAGGAYMLRPIQTGLNGLPLLNKNANPGQFINLISFNECFFLNKRS